MKLETKTIDIKQKILIAAKKRTPFVNKLKSYLEKLGAEVFYSSVLPKSLELFDINFIIDEKNFFLTKKKPVKKIIFIFINQPKLAYSLTKKIPDNYKIINIDGNLFTDNDIDKILWFSFSKTKEKYLNLFVKKTTQQPKINFPSSLSDIKNFIKPKNLILGFLIIFFILHLFFIFPLAATSFFSYQTYKHLKNENFARANDSLKWQKIFLDLTKKTYSFAQPTLLFLSLAKTPNDLIEINDKTNISFEKIINIEKGLKEMITLLLKKDKSANEIDFFNLRLTQLNKDSDEITDNLTVIANKIPTNLPQINNLKKTIIENLTLISELKKIFPFADELFAKNGEKKYLLLFANNMEIRPGGGFIGSFGIITMKNYTLEGIKIYDVYDADGQLKAHIEPPLAIRKYLKQPHWFLRDSAFSPDFPENYEQAKKFLDRELNLKDFSGGLLITTSAIENILEAFGELYLPDFKEIITSKNFYLKAQYYAEKQFFPGSIQKKSFLSAILNQIIINIDTASEKKLASAIKKSLDEKQLIVYLENSRIQSVFESLLWSGRIIEPKCINNQKNCLVDFLMPIDANLGVNKANFFINRLITLKTNLNPQGKINHLLSVVFKNESQSNVFPGGSYKNYFQVYLPKNTIINSITKNGVLVNEDLIINEVKNDWFRVIALFFEVLPKTSSEIKIDYQLKDSFEKGKGVYQLIVQKQIGSTNNDFISEIYLPKNFYLLSQNFVPLVKANQILYNTYLSTDKIFFVELVKE